MIAFNLSDGIIKSLSPIGLIDEMQVDFKCWFPPKKISFGPFFTT